MNGKMACLVALVSIAESLGKMYSARATFYRSRAKAYGELGKNIKKLSEALQNMDK